MSTIFTWKLVNGPFGDPVLHVRLRGERGALLFDLGEIGGLSPSEIMRVSDVFVTHAHIDHFIGFDHLLRIVLGRDKLIRFHGPPGLAAQVRGKLAGYTWNLVEDYRLELEVREFHGASVRGARFSCRSRFRDETELPEQACDGLLLDAPRYSVSGALLDHRTPCVGYALREKVQVNVFRDRLAREGLAVGPWLTDMKRLFAEGRTEERVAALEEGGGTREVGVGEAVRLVARTSPGRKIVYLSDLADTPDNEERVTALAAEADVVFCEAAFLDADRERAARTSHLTAAAAGRLAGRSGAARLVVFHFSPRYTDREEYVRREAEESFQRHRAERGKDAAPSGTK